jgi:hypothetical protein
MGMADGAKVKPEGRALQPARRTVAGKEELQLRAPRKDGWTRDQEKLFLQTLATTCNTSEAARVAGVCRATAYDRKQRNPRFAADWERALDIGYAEIEAMLMREVLFGGESEEIVLDGEGVVKSRKVKRGRDLKLALQLLTRHRDRVLAYRANAVAGGPDSPVTVAKVRRAMDEMVRKRAATGT